MTPGTCHLYVLPLAYEDVVKVGVSADPLARVRAFASRYYECFDLARSALVVFDRAAEARRRETELHRLLRSWNAVQPLTVPARAGGHTEWYRGAAAVLREEIERDRQRGHVVHMPAGDWWRERLQRDLPLLYEWGSQWLRAESGDAMPAQAWQNVVDVLDAWPALDLAVEDAIPAPLARRYRRYRSAWRSGLAE